MENSFDTIWFFFVALYTYFATIPWNYVFALVHDVIVAFDILMLAGIVYVLIELAPYRPRFVADPKRLVRRERKIPTLQTEGLAEKWVEIMKKAEATPSQSLTLAVIEADSFVDTILKKMNLPGEHFADRLDKLGSEFVTVDALWKAHRVRNDVVHTPGFVLAPHDARRYLADYAAFLKEIEVIE